VIHSIQDGLSRTEYLRFRAPYSPDRRKIVFVLESPPKSGLYFYNPGGRVSEPLFSAMMKDLIGTKPESKDQGLREFASRGFLLIDATYSPVNHDHLSLKERNKRILDDLPVLLEELREYVGPETGVVLVKANVADCWSRFWLRMAFRSSITEGQFLFRRTDSKTSFRRRSGRCWDWDLRLVV
jgi:hypothetical protein